MSKFQEKYKRRPGGMDDATGRNARASFDKQRRRVNRAEFFSRYRDVSPNPKQDSETTRVSNLNARLRNWKIEKARQKELEKQKKKPVFKVGVVHHHLWSPTVKDRSNTSCHTRSGHGGKTQPSPPKRITRATQKRLEAKKVAAPSGSASAATVSRLVMPKKRTPAKTPLRITFAPASYAFKGPAGVQPIPMFSRFAVTKDSANEQLQELKASMDKPWPVLSNAANPVAPSPLKKRNTLVQQDATDTSELFKKVERTPKDSCVTNNKAKTRHAPSDIATSDASSSGSPSPAMFSPYVTTSRGKDEARRERRSKMGIARTPPDAVPTKDTVMQSLNISVEEEERTAQYFKFILEREIERLNEVCEKWEGVRNEPSITEDARYLINQAIGQTMLLMRKKFERFRGLVADCETGKGEMLVQCRDLQGFWDMTYVEVKNCDSRFQKLEELRSRGWVEEEDNAVKVNKRAGLRQKSLVNKFTVNAKSSARSWILQKRKAMSESGEKKGDAIIVSDNSEPSTPAISGTTAQSSPRVLRRSVAGDSPRSLPKSVKRLSLKLTPKKTPKKTPASLLRKVQLSETKKNFSSPLAVMKISRMCKTPEVRLDDTISYVNSDQTPGRGILKKSEEPSEISKSSRKVDFHETVLSEESRIDEHLENSIDLGHALARIDSYDSATSDDVFETENSPPKNVTVRRVEKRLDFEDDAEFTDAAESSSVADTPVFFAFPPPDLLLSTKSEVIENGASTIAKKKRASRSLVESSNQEDNAEGEVTTRVLRTRIVSMTTPKKNTRRSMKSSSPRKELVDLDSSTQENHDPNTRVQNSTLSKPTRVRRSTRKSVRFNAEDCTACADSAKPVHPMTPHSRRSRKISLLGDDTRPSVGVPFDGNLISFDSPAKISLPPRVRRSSAARKKSSS